MAIEVKNIVKKFGAFAALDEGRGADYVNAVFPAVHGTPVDLSRRSEFIDVLRKAGFDARYMAGGHYAWKAIGGKVRLFE